MATPSPPELIGQSAAWLESLRPWQRPPAFPADLDISTRGNRFSILFVPRGLIELWERAVRGLPARVRELMARG